jgi:hypothetical protein
VVECGGLEMPLDRYQRRSRAVTLNLARCNQSATKIGDGGGSAPVHDHARDSNPAARSIDGLVSRAFSATRWLRRHANPRGGSSTCVDRFAESLLLRVGFFEQRVAAIDGAGIV